MALLRRLSLARAAIDRHCHEIVNVRFAVRIFRGDETPQDQAERASGAGDGVSRVRAIWDGLIAIERRIVRLIPWTRFKQAFAVVVDFLPAPVVLLIFLVPLLIIEPLLTVCVVAIAMGYVVTGVIAWILLKLLAIALIPAIFDLTQHKLMTMPWFVRGL